MKILITGGSGALGFRLNELLSNNHEVYSTYNNNEIENKNVKSIHLVLSDKEKIYKLFKDVNPDVVIHTAGISNPSKANEISTKEVYDINVNASENIAKLCNEYSAKLIYTSTDLVYAGYRGKLLSEDSKLVPLSLYAETKLMGEEKIKSTFKNYIILRTALLYDLRKENINNYFNWMFNEFANGNKVNLFVDQYRSPLSIKDGARIIGKLIDKNVEDEVINFGGPERLNRVELAEILCEEANFSKKLINKISMNDIENFVKVEDVSMNIDKLRSLGIEPKSNRKIIKDLLKDINE